MKLDYEQRIKNAFAEIIVCAECGNNTKFNAELTPDECKLIRKVIKRETGKDLKDFIKSRTANFREDLDICFGGEE